MTFRTYLADAEVFARRFCFYFVPPRAVSRKSIRTGEAQRVKPTRPGIQYNNAYKYMKQIERHKQ